MSSRSAVLAPHVWRLLVPDKTWVEVAQFAVNLILAFVTISLFVQGQRDRRRVENDRSRDQATKISLLRHEVSERTRPMGGGFAESWSIRGTNVTVRNDSELPITQVSVFTTERLEWPQHSDPFAPRKRFQGELVQFPQLKTQPFGLSVLPGESLTYDGDPLRSHYLRLRFTDGAGAQWVKDTIDGKLWPAALPSTWRSKVTQNIVGTPRLRWLAWLIHWAPLEHANREFRKTESGIPWSARWVRFTWGVPPIGAPDPWDMPLGAPAKEWPYDLWIDMTRREKQRRWRGPCGLRQDYPIPHVREPLTSAETE